MGLVFPPVWALTLVGQVTLGTMRTPFPLTAHSSWPLTGSHQGPILGNWTGDIPCPQRGFSAIQELSLGLGSLQVQKYLAEVKFG